MKYLVICKNQSAFYTDWFTFENCWNPETCHCVIDLYSDKVTFDGQNWKDIEIDHL